MRALGLPRPALFVLFGLRRGGSRTFQELREVYQARLATGATAGAAVGALAMPNVVRALIAVLRVTPDVIVRAAGTVLGLAFYTIDRPHRRIAERNLATAFRGRPEAERTAIARAAF